MQRCTSKIFILLFLSIISINAYAGPKVELFKEMFAQVVVKKDVNLFSKYYTKDFLLYSNGIEMDFDQMIEMHKKVYATPIQYSLEYDNQTWVEQGDRIAGRIWITTSKPNEKPVKIEVMLIAEYKADQLYRIWELTLPNWSTLKTFENTL